MKKMIVLASIVAIAGVSLVSYASTHNGKLQKEFGRTTRGEMRSDVIQRMGTPSSSNKPCQNDRFWVDHPVSNSQCVDEFVYYANALPKYWTIGFDKNGRAVTKYTYVSP